MSRKTLILLGVMAGLVLAIVLAKTVRFSHVPKLDSIDGWVDEIVIKNKTNAEVKLYKKNDKWVIGPEAYPAEELGVLPLIQKIREVKFSEFVTSTTFFERFDLTDDTAIRVKASVKGKLVRDILIGKKGGSGDQSFVRLPDKKEVYLAGDALFDAYNKSVDTLRNKNLITNTVDQIDQVTIAYKGQSFTLKRQKADPNTTAAKSDDTTKTDPAEPAKDIWVVDGKTPVDLDQQRVTDLLGEFASVTATDFPDEKSIKPLISKQLGEVSVKGKNGETVMKIYDKESKENGGAYVCFSSVNPYYAHVESYKAEKFLISIKDLVKK